jgi:DNA primase
MAGTIPRNFIDEVLLRTDIINIVGSRIELKKRGKNFLALCPFHPEKTPSFTVSAEKQFFHCFGCGVSGNAIGFLMQFEKLSFPEAVENLAIPLGLKIPQTNLTSPEEKQLANYFVLLEQVTKLYQKTLSNNQKAKDYLLQRKINQEMITLFELGFSASSYNNLEPVIKIPRAKDALIKTGMLIEKNLEVFPRFRDRFMFPIRNIPGKIIGFGGRAINNENLPKYLNSPETILFNKGSELYGLYQVLKNNRRLEQILVTEGYLDVISLFQFGIKNVVATLGTAITPRQLQKLLRYSKEIIFCFDGDEAGRKAAWRALENILPLLREGIQIRFLLLPSTDDPDSLIRKEGKEKFSQRINEALVLSDFMFGELSQGLDLEKPDHSSKLVQKTRELLQKMPSSIFKKLLLSKLSELVKMDLGSVDFTAPTPASIINPKASTNEDIQLSHEEQKAVFILLNYPPLAKKASQILGDKLPLNAEGLPIILLELINLLKNTPNLNIGAIIEYWRGTPKQAIIASLATRELLIAKEEAEKELIAILNRLDLVGHAKEIKILLAKAKSGELNLSEKQKLQKLIMESKKR